MDWTNKRVLVTGGAGFLGSHVVEKLRAKGAKVFAPRSAHYDLRYRHVVEDLIDPGVAEVVIHCAAMCGGIGANQSRPADFAYDNLMMGANLIEACVSTGIKLVLIGTTCSYPKDAPLPLRESDLWNGYPEPTNAPYGIAKRMLLTMAQAYRAQYGLNAIYLIPANLYGPRDNFDLETGHVIPAIVRKCIEAQIRGEDSITLWGDGTPTREFLYVEDAATGILHAAEGYDGAEPVNLGSGWQVTISELARQIAEATGYKGEFVFDSSKPNGQPSRVLNTDRAWDTFYWGARTRLKQGLEKTVAWYRNSLLNPDAAELFTGVTQ